MITSRLLPCRPRRWTILAPRHLMVALAFILAPPAGAAPFKVQALKKDGGVIEGGLVRLDAKEVYIEAADGGLQKVPRDPSRDDVIVTTDQKRYEGRILAASDEQITFNIGGMTKRPFLRNLVQSVTVAVNPNTAYAATHKDIEAGNWPQALVDLAREYPPLASSPEQAAQGKALFKQAYDKTKEQAGNLVVQGEAGDGAQLTAWDAGGAVRKPFTDALAEYTLLSQMFTGAGSAFARQMLGAQSDSEAAAVKKDTANCHYRFARALWKAQREPLYPEAETNAQRAIELAGQPAPACFLLGEVQLRLGTLRNKSAEALKKQATSLMEQAAASERANAAALAQKARDDAKALEAKAASDKQAARDYLAKAVKNLGDARKDPTGLAEDAARSELVLADANNQLKAVSAPEAASAQPPAPGVPVAAATPPVAAAAPPVAAAAPPAKAAASGKAAKSPTPAKTPETKAAPTPKAVASAQPGPNPPAPGTKGPSAAGRPGASPQDIESSAVPPRPRPAPSVGGTFKEAITRYVSVSSTRGRFAGAKEAFGFMFGQIPGLASGGSLFTWVGIAVGLLIVFVVSKKASLRFMMARAQGGDPSAGQWLQATHRWGPFGVLGYLFASLAANFSDRFGSKERKRCPNCNKAIDNIEAYEDLDFVVCPYCRENITPIYSVKDYIQHLVSQLDAAAVRRHKGEEEGLLERDAVSKLLRSVVTMGYTARASDLHVEPGEQSSLIRCRIDGMLQDMLELPRTLTTAFSNHVKILCDLDISEKRVPQDGKFDIYILNTNLDVRVSTVPVKFGEKVTMRILDALSINKNLSDLGLEGDNLQRFTESIYQPHGLVVLTGPTSSGKTTTLMVALNQINTGDKNIVTLENPIEYELKGVNQMQINEPQNFTFATGLRSILRQDPDVIMVGEIRDTETAQIAIEASVTGHLVFSTLHTNNAVGVFPRLTELGVKASRYAWALNCVVAQRLARTICPECRRPYRPKINELETVHLENASKDLVFYRGGGCDLCSKTGYYGRLGLFEILRLNDTIREVLETDASLATITDIAKKKAGMKTLTEEGVLKVLQGLTTIEEVLRVTKE